MPKANIGDVELEYKESGQGEPVVFVHGSISDWRTWDAQLAAVGKKHRAIAYSRRFHWPNPPMPKDSAYRMEQQIDDLAKLLGVLDAKPAHIVGNSWGAYVALGLAMRHPDCVRTLVLEEPPVLPLFVGVPPQPARLLPLFFTRPRTAIAFVQAVATGLAPAESALKKGDRDGALRLFARMVLTPRWYDRLTPERHEQIRANLASLEVDVLGTAFLPLTDADIRAIKVPTLMAAGEESPPILRRLAERMLELLPRGAAVRIPRASHLMHEDNPPETNRAILSFLEKHAERSPPATN